MKKFFAIFAVLLLSACGGMIKNENGSENIVQLEGEPIGCTFLYKLESEVSVYDAEDARPGNAYWIVAQRTRPNKWVMFGPERAFVLTANVYDCPHPGMVRTARDGGSATISVEQPEPCPYGCGVEECTTIYGPCNM